MKIGMLVDTYLPIVGGAEIHVLELSRALRDAGYEIEVCTATPGSREADEFPVTRLPRLAGGGWRAFLQIPLALPSLIRFIRRADFVHCHYSFLLAALGTILGRLLGRRTAVTLHGQGTLDSSVGKHPLWRLYRFIALKCGNVIIATSEEMAAVARRFTSSEKIVLIPNGVNIGKFTSQPKPAGQETVILTMRRLAPKNGVQYLIEAAPEVIRAIPKARFWVAGEGKLEDHIRQRVAELGLETHVRFIGIVPHAQTPDYYRQADIVVFPSSAESTSLACLEAMSMQKAVVASSLATYKEMLGTNGERGLLVALFDREDSDYDAPLTLQPERISALAQAIIRLAQDAALRRCMGESARRFVVEHYNWRAIAEQTSRIYRP